MDNVFKALADSGRRKLLDALFARDGQTLSELCTLLDMSRQAVTKHLRILEQADLVSTQRRGREKLHFLNALPISRIQDRWIAKYARQRLRALNRLKDSLE